MCPRLHLVRRDDGNTLVELMVASMVLVLGVLGAFALLDGANRTTVSNNGRIGATNLGRELLENARWGGLRRASRRPGCSPRCAPRWATRPRRCRGP